MRANTRLSNRPSIICRNGRSQALADIVKIGITPIFAHPERNADVQRDPTVLRKIVAVGACVQLTAMSVEGVNGDRAQSRRVLDAGQRSALP